MEAKKICPYCNTEKPITEFYKVGNYKGKESRLRMCIKCTNQKRKAYNNEYRQKNKEVVNEKKREYYQKKMNDLQFVENVNNGQRKRYSRYVYNRLFNNCKTRAEKRNLEFNITIEDIVIPDKCPLLEIDIFTGTKEDYSSSPTVDRIDNTKGYIKGNIKIISSLANTMKNCATLEQLMLFCKNMETYLMNKEIVQPIENQKSIELKDKEPLG